MQDYKEIIKETIKEALETTNAQAYKVTDKLTKLMFTQCIVICSTFALILIFLFGFYFIGYRDYPQEVKYNVEENQRSSQENILQTSEINK